MSGRQVWPSAKIARRFATGVLSFNGLSYLSKVTFRGKAVFKFLFGEKIKAAITPESKRQKLERALAEVNEVLAALDPKPKISIDIAAGRVDIAMPEHFPDEARALPAPVRQVAADDAAGTPVTGTSAAASGTVSGGAPTQPTTQQSTIAEPTKLQPRVPEPRVPTPNPPKPKTPAPKTKVSAKS